MAEPTESLPQDPDESSAEDVKERMRQALEAKQARHRNERLHPEGDSALHEPHSRSGGKRAFRRKAGP
jgi:hypothetical protein